MKLLALDLSSSCTGWALFNIEEKQLLSFGSIPKRSGKGKTKYRKLLNSLRNMVSDVLDVIKVHEPDKIVIEEINRGSSRLGQKTLDGVHFLLLDKLEDYIDKVNYIDSDGKVGWRTKLGLKLSPIQKLKNKELKQLNKQLKTKIKNKNIITKKDLAIDYVNKRFNLQLSLEQNDIADSIGLGIAFILHG
jgi:Holliday junction resolvasome RuvABC endonuclease subunit